MIPASKAALISEFVTLRRGWGILSTNLRQRLGPELCRLCDIQPKASEREMRDKVIATVRRLGRELSDDDRRAIDIALGADRAAQFASLKRRTSYLATALSCAERTARRRIDRAFELLADEAIAQQDKGDHQPDDPEKGWQVRTFEALFRLDTPAPELIETRTIVATRDGLRTIAVRFSLPKREDGEQAERQLAADVQQGARIVHRERQGEAHFRYLLELPRPLSRGDEHNYTIVFRVPVNQPIRSHYAFVPLVDCDVFRVKVRFDPAQLPTVVWKLDRLPPRVLADRLTPGAPLELDGAAESVLEFRDVERGFGYGLAWLP